MVPSTIRDDDDSRSRGTPPPGGAARPRATTRAVLEAARDRCFWRPDTPVAAVAARAGVGIGALYRRYATKDEPAAPGLPRGPALASSPRPRRRPTTTTPDAPYRASSGTSWTPTSTRSPSAWRGGSPRRRRCGGTPRARARARALVERAVTSNAVRADAVPGDLDLVLEGCAAIRVPDPSRTADSAAVTSPCSSTSFRRRGRGELPGPRRTTARWGGAGARAPGAARDWLGYAVRQTPITIRMRSSSRLRTWFATIPR